MAESLKEFLVSVSWASDPASQKKFTDALEGATLRANILADAIEKMAIYAATAVSDSAKSFETMALTAERTKSSSENIKALDYAFQQLGRAQGDSTKLLESFNAQLDKNRGYRDQIETGLHVPLRDVNGVLKDNATLMRDIGIAIAKTTDPQQRTIWANMYGFDPERDTQTFSHAAELMAAFAEKLKRLQALGQTGIDAKKTEEDAVAFETRWRSIWDRFGGWGETAMNKAMSAALPYMKSFDEWLAHEQAIAQSDLTPAEKLRRLTDLSQFAGPDYGGGNTKPYVVPPSKTLDAIINWLGKLFGMSAHAEGAGGSSPFGSLTGRGAFGGSGVLVNGIPVSSGNPLPVYDPRSGTAQSFSGEGMSVGGSSSMPEGAGRPSGATNFSQPYKAQAATKSRQEAYNYWIGQGLSPERAAEVIGNEMGEGGLMGRRAGRGDGGNVGGDFQWDPIRRAQILAATGIDVLTASDLDQQRAARWEMEHGPGGGHIWNKLKGTTGPIGSGTPILVHEFERSGNQAKDIAWRTANARSVAAGLAAGANPSPFGTLDMNAFGGLGVTGPQSMNNDNSVTNSGHTVNSPVTINVDGSGGDAHTLAQMVGSSVRRANQDIVANLRGSFA